MKIPSNAPRGLALLLLAIPITLAPLIGCSSDDLLLARLGVVAAVNTPALVEITPNITYATRGDLHLRLDLYRPLIRTGAAPIVLVVHGGSWRSGSKEDMTEFAYDVAARGMAAATIDYRLIQQGGTFPASILDVIDAGTFLRENAVAWGLDAERIGLLGVSAGGYLVLMAGLVADLSVLDPSRPTGRPFEFKAVVNVEGPTDFTEDPSLYTSRQIRLIEGYLGITVAEDPDGTLRHIASPVTHARESGPPVLTIHGTADQTVPILQAESLQAALSAAGEAHEYLPIEGMDHVPGALWWGPYVQGYRAAMLDFLDDALQ